MNKPVDEAYPTNPLVMFFTHVAATTELTRMINENSVDYNENISNEDTLPQTTLDSETVNDELREIIDV